MIAVAKGRAASIFHGVRRPFYLSLGFLSLGLGTVGIVLPLLPTVPFVILAAFCFARSNRQLEARLLNHRHFGPHIERWREYGAISRRGKRTAVVAFAASGVTTIALVPWPWPLVSVTAMSMAAIWIMRRPEAG